MSRNDEPLSDLRRQIDEIDDRIHDLLMQRTEVAQRIGTVKAGDSIYLRPGREAMVLRRLLARHRGALPKALIVRIWREIFAAVTALQGSFAVAVYAPEGSFGYRNLARDQYGWRTPIAAYRSAAQVLEAVREGRATVGVLPVPRVDETEAWWRNLAQNGPGVPRIVARLPFAVVEAPRADSPEALAISLAMTEPTDRDHAYLVLEMEETFSRSHLKQLLGTAGFETVEMQVLEEAGGRTLSLIEVEGFVAEDDPRSAALLAAADNGIAQIWAVGGFAVPVALEDMEKVRR